jgi:hypothetical protein
MARFLTLYDGCGKKVLEAKIGGVQCRYSNYLLITAFKDLKSSAKLSLSVSVSLSTPARLCRDSLLVRTLELKQRSSCRNSDKITEVGMKKKDCVSTCEYFIKRFFS